MATADVELVRRVIPAERFDLAANVEDEGYWRTAAEAVHPEAPIRFIAPDGGSVIPGPFAGAEGMRAGWREWLNAWERFEIEVADVIDAGDGTVLALGNNRGSLEGSGIEIEQQGGIVYRIAEGRIVAIDLYLDADRARRAAGL